MRGCNPSGDRGKPIGGKAGAIWGSGKPIDPSPDQEDEAVACAAAIAGHTSNTSAPRTRTAITVTPV